MMFRKISLVVLLLMVVSTVAVPFTAVNAQAKPLKIGLLTDKTSALAIYGTELSNGFTLGLQYATQGKMEVGGRKIEVIEKDTANKPETGVSVAQELVEKLGAEILVGAPSSGVTVAVQQVSKDADVILMAGPAATPNLTGKGFDKNTFRVCRNTYQDFLGYASYAKSGGVGTKFIILAADNEFGKSSTAAAEAVFKAAGIEFVKATIYAPLETKDFTPYLQQVLSSGAQVLMPIWAGDGSVALYQQIQELGVLKKMAVIGGFNSNPITKAAPPALVGTQGWIVYHYTLPKTEINDWLIKEHKDKFKTPPDLFTECSFASAQALVAALDKSKGDATPKALAPALEGLTFKGPKGDYVIRPGDHQALVPMYIVELQNQNDPDFKFYKLLKEVPAKDIVPPCEAPADRCKMNDAMK